MCVNQRAAPLAYSNFPGVNGLRIIAVGGQALSRGLTLEGLCISYFYRDSKAYDTLLQWVVGSATGKVTKIFSEFGLIQLSEVGSNLSRML